MEIIIKAWPVAKTVLGIIFLLCCLSLPFLLISIAVSKKKLITYIGQVNRTGTIHQIKDLDESFDLFLVSHVFDKPSKVKNNPSYTKFRILLELEDSIELLTKIVKIISFVFGITVVLLLVFLNLFEK